MQLGFALSLAYPGSVSFNPSSLFMGGEVGVWYDPSDFSTMFQDAAGTTPVTAVEQPVGLLLDKSKGLVLGAELVTNGDFSNGTTGWAKQVNVTWSVVDGVLNATSLVGNSGIYTTMSVSAGKTYVLSGEISNLSATANAGLRIGTAFYGAQYGSFLVWTGKAVFTATETGTAHIWMGVNTAGLTTTFDNISVRELPGAHAVQATSTKRPILKQDGNGKYYLLFDGVDDALSTGSIDFTSADKMTVVAGVRKLGDAARGILVELSALSTDVRRFILDAPLDTIKKYRIVMSGDGVTNPEYAYTGDQYASPHTSVVTGVLNRKLTTNSTILRINGQLNGTFLSPFTYIDTFGNYPLYIGSRGGTSLPFNGRLYSLIVRGAQSSEAQILSAETYCNQKTGAY